MQRSSQGKLCLFKSHDVHHLCRNTLLLRQGSLSAKKRSKTCTHKYTRRISIRVFTISARNRIVKVIHRRKLRTAQLVSKSCLKSSKGLPLKKIDYQLLIKQRNHHQNYISDSFRCLILEIAVIISSLISRLNQAQFLITAINH